MSTDLNSVRRVSHARRNADERRQVADLPMLLNVEDAAELLRTTRRAIYAMVERRQLPGVIRIGRRVLFHTTELLNWLD